MTTNDNTTHILIPSSFSQHNIASNRLFGFLLQFIKVYLFAHYLLLYTLYLERCDYRLITYQVRDLIILNVCI
jgi:hypothetical protein